MNKKHSNFCLLSKEKIDKIRGLLFEKAIEKHGEIFSCGNKVYNKCFVVYGNRYTFWYNTIDGSTHMTTYNICDDHINN